MSTDLITLGKGCFGCVDAVFKQADAVQAVQSGYCAHVVAPKVANFKKIIASRVWA